MSKSPGKLLGVSVLAVSLSAAVMPAYSAYTPTLTDHARCVAVARVKAVNSQKPAEARHFAAEAARAEAKAREVGAAAGKTPAQINAALKLHLQMMNTPDPRFPNKVDDNLALCIKDGLLRPAIS